MCWPPPPSASPALPPPSIQRHQRNGIRGYREQSQETVAHRNRRLPFETWAGLARWESTFDADANNDGVDNGMAWVLGAANPDDDALGLLPTPTEDGSGDLVLTFDMLDSASRGTATLSVEHSSDLGIGDPWTTVAVPDASGGPTSGVTFVVSGSGTLDVTATIGSAEAGGTGKLFGRLKAVETP